jgi:rsbT antagonist protein RsbS
MDRVPILKIGTTLFVSIQIDLQDESVVRLQEDLADELAATGARGVIIDITAVEIVDSFIGRMLAMIGSLRGVRTALNAEKGIELLNGSA